MRSPDTLSVGLGPLSFDMAQARDMGLSAEAAENVWTALAAVWRSYADAAAHAAGRTAKCRYCECWTTPGECIHCAAGRFVPVGMKVTP